MTIKTVGCNGCGVVTTGLCAVPVPDSDAEELLCGECMLRKITLLRREIEILTGQLADADEYSADLVAQNKDYQQAFLDIKDILNEVF